MYPGLGGGGGSYSCIQPMESSLGDDNFGHSKNPTPIHWSYKLCPCTVRNRDSNCLLVSIYGQI